MGRWVVAVVVCLFTGVLARPALAERGDGRTAPWGGADLNVRIEATPQVAQPGQPLVYRVMVHNSGPGDAVLPVLTVTLPREVEIMSVDVSECRPGRGYNEVVCRSPRDVLAGGSGGVTITALVRPSARGPLRAQASLTSEVLDGHDEDNQAEAVTNVDEGADLAVRFRPARGVPRPGERFTMEAVVANRGPRVVRDAFVYLQAGRAQFLAGTGARCHAFNGFVGCALQPIRSGGQTRFQLAFRAPARVLRTRPVQARATVYSRGLGDRRPANNQARLRMAINRGT
ncbi:DUF11 domain-containing protein [Acrocarpospora catenulata]|uniref:DUF11 domain-containing protein n=1 Tax=Acrocarpospora catenulata TaxID=2836182 RepID=UPI001BDAED5E|nr:DUF11 domain-containing protein [Acrocarpospora catenulata]